MFAETVHTIFLSLPPSEQNRFLSMVHAPVREKKQKVRTLNKVPSKEQYLDMALKVLNARK